MKGFSELNGLLWPIRYKPKPDELLSSWLVRLAVGHGMKVQTFCNRIFGNQRQVWNRDIDRLAPEWLLEELSIRTGTPIVTANATTLRTYDGFLYQGFRPSGTLPWVLTLGMYHRKRQGYGQQFCAACLASDATPYFRRAWRVSFNTVCSIHKLMLHDRCPKCEAPVSYHRMEMGRSSNFESTGLTGCHECGFDLRESPLLPITTYKGEIRRWMIELSKLVTQGAGPKRLHLNMEHLLVMHQLSKLLLSTSKHVHLHECLCDYLTVDEKTARLGDRISIETRDINERHHLMQLIVWLMIDLEPRLRMAWRSKSLRYNSLLKDFHDPPVWFANIAEGFSNWRDHQ